MNAEGEEGKESREELEQYLATVVTELKTREEKLGSIETAIAALESEIKRGSGRALRTDSGAMSSHQAFLKTLRRKLEARRAERDEALDEVQKARERREIIEEELRGTN